MANRESGPDRRERRGEGASGEEGGGRKQNGEREENGASSEGEWSGERGGKGAGESKEHLRDDSSDGDGGPADADARRIGPWHAPDFQRQVKLATRLANPEYRSTRSARSRVTTSARNGRHPDQYPREGSANGYRNPRPGTYNGRGVLDHRLSSEPSIRNSPLNASHRRQRTYTTYSRMSSSSSSSSPRRGPRGPTTPVSPPRQAPLYATPSDRTVSSEELDTIIGRVTRPTVASRGGVDIMNKDFTYIKPQRLKTLPVIPGLDRRYMGLQNVSNGQLNDIVSRLTRMTSAYEAKFAQNRNVWVDREPGAHLVRLRKGQTV